MGKIKPFVCIALLTFLSSSIFAIPSSTLIQGYEAYRDGNWGEAAIFLRRARSESESEDILYMLIMCGMYSADYATALNDCDSFLEKYSKSSLAPAVLYQKGRALHYLLQNDRAVIVLSDFCHENPRSPLYASALFWLGECFYDDYNYDTASALYSRVVDEFPKDEKAIDAQKRLEAISRTEREQKLLYLLKMTGEEYLVSRENYERQLRQYQTEDMIALRRQLNAANARIAELEKVASETVSANQNVQENQNVQNTSSQSEETENPSKDSQESKEKENRSEEMQMLKEKAELLQKLLDEKSQK